MIFIFQFVNIMHLIDSFVYIKESLHPWDKSDLIMVYSLLYIYIYMIFLMCC